jgi:hypothetical protein
VDQRTRDIKKFLWLLREPEVDDIQPRQRGTASEDKANSYTEDEVIRIIAACD